MITTTYYQALTTNITYGTGDVYSTAAGYGIPIASNNFTATSTQQRVFNVTSTQVVNVETTLNRTVADATPACSLLTPDECSKLYVSYVSSLGLPVNASVPKITPAPANSPPCPTYYYKPFTTCTDSFVTNYPDDCTIMGNSVKLFYFPSPTSTACTGTANVSATITAAPQVVYEYAPGTTFTSPSIYLKFDYLSAHRVFQGNDARICSICDKNGCRAKGVDGGQQLSSEGTVIAGQLVTLAPEEVSSIVLDYNAQEAASIVSTMALGLPGYADVMNKIIGNFNVTAQPLRLEDVLHPPPEAYYLQPLDNAPGCDVAVPQPQCSTIFEGAYRALISLPQEVTGLQGPWRSCAPVIYGVYDPPIALTRASTAAGITLPNGYRTTTASNEQTTQTTTAEPANLPDTPAVPTPTALPDQVPGQNGDSGSSGGSSNNGSSGNGGSSNTDGGSQNGGSTNNNGNNSNGGSNDGGSGTTGGSGTNNGGQDSSNGGSGNGNTNNGGSGSGSGSGSDVTQLVLPGATLSPGSKVVVSGTTYSLPATGAGVFVNGQSTSLPNAEAGSPITLPNGVVATVAVNNNNNNNNNGGVGYVYVDSNGSTHTTVIGTSTAFVDSQGSTHTVASRTTTRRSTGTGTGTTSSGDSATAASTTSTASSASRSIEIHMPALVFSVVLVAAQLFVT